LYLTAQTPSYEKVYVCIGRIYGILFVM
jgi:hypothetical protein